MFKIFITLLAIFFSTSAIAKECSPLLDFNVRTLNEKTIVNLCEQYQGKVILIVNTASRCAYTDQYDSLEKLYSEFMDEGFVVLGFPSNDFGHQEPGTEKQIRDFCRLTYGVKFPMFAKTGVTERNADPLYKTLAMASGTYPQWNFHKYLIDRNGRLVADYRSGVDPLDKSVTGEIKKYIKKF
ncbi:MAG: glutathione peroxidase [Gammaproteobacteria bacterium]|jgi:glutathione peroxidase